MVEASNQQLIERISHFLDSDAAQAVGLESAKAFLKKKHNLSDEDIENAVALYQENKLNEELEGETKKLDSSKVNRTISSNNLKASLTAIEADSSKDRKFHGTPAGRINVLANMLAYAATGAAFGVAWQSLRVGERLQRVLGTNSDVSQPNGDISAPADRPGTGTPGTFAPFFSPVGPRGNNISSVSFSTGGHMNRSTYSSVSEIDGQRIAFGEMVEGIRSMERDTAISVAELKAIVSGLKQELGNTLSSIISSHATSSSGNGDTVAVQQSLSDNVNSLAQDVIGLRKDLAQLAQLEQSRSPVLNNRTESSDISPANRSVDGNMMSNNVRSSPMRNIVGNLFPGATVSGSLVGANDIPLTPGKVTLSGFIDGPSATSANISSTPLQPQPSTPSHSPGNSRGGVENDRLLGSPISAVSPYPVHRSTAANAPSPTSLAPELRPILHARIKSLVRSALQSLRYPSFSQPSSGSTDIPPTPERLSLAYKTIRLVIQNIVSNPGVTRYRRLARNNRSLLERLFLLRNSDRVMTSLGFVLVGAPSSTSSRSNVDSSSEQSGTNESYIWVGFPLLSIPSVSVQQAVLNAEEQDQRALELRTSVAEAIEANWLGDGHTAVEAARKILPASNEKESLLLLEQLLVDVDEFLSQTESVVSNNNSRVNMDRGINSTVSPTNNLADTEKSVPAASNVTGDNSQSNKNNSSTGGNAVGVRSISRARSLSNASTISNSSTKSVGIGPSALHLGARKAAGSETSSIPKNDADVVAAALPPKFPSTSSISPSAISPSTMVTSSTSIVSNSILSSSSNNTTNTNSNNDGIVVRPRGLSNASSVSSTSRSVGIGPSSLTTSLAKQASKSRAVIANRDNSVKNEVGNKIVNSTESISPNVPEEFSADLSEISAGLNVSMLDESLSLSRVTAVVNDDTRNDAPSIHTSTAQMVNSPPIKNLDLSITSDLHSQETNEPLKPPNSVPYAEVVRLVNEGLADLLPNVASIPELISASAPLLLPTVQSAEAPPKPWLVDSVEDDDSSKGNVEFNAVEENVELEAETGKEDENAVRESAFDGGSAELLPSPTSQVDENVEELGNDNSSNIASISVTPETPAPSGNPPSNSSGGKKKKNRRSHGR